MATKACLNTKATETESKNPDIFILITKVALSAKATEIKNKKPDATGFITTPEFNKFVKTNFDARMKQIMKCF